MTVAELIAELQKLPQDAPICTGAGVSVWEVPPSSVRQEKVWRHDDGYRTVLLAPEDPSNETVVVIRD